MPLEENKPPKIWPGNGLASRHLLGVGVVVTLGVIRLETGVFSQSTVVNG